MYRYTVIVYSIVGRYVHTHHYKTKADALGEVAQAIGRGYKVEVMKYSVYINR